MADRILDLVSVMSQETKTYGALEEFAQKKREFVVGRNLEELEELTTKEQNLASDLKNLEKKRVALLKEISAELGEPDRIVTVSEALERLNDSEEKEQLSAARDQLVEAASRMQFLNQQNEILLQQALEMVDFDLTLFKSMRAAPETANYGRDAYNTGDILPSGGFDAKQ